MSRKPREFSLLPEALQEAIEAAAWYDSQQLGLGHDFHAELKDAIQRIRANPFAHSRLEEYDGQYEIRRCLLKRFSYLVIFEIDNDELSVITVAHVRRKPFFWTSRLSK